MIIIPIQARVPRPRIRTYTHTIITTSCDRCRAQALTRQQRQPPAQGHRRRYNATQQLTEKSLLEAITGRPAILRDPEPAHIVQWACCGLARGDIEGVADVRMAAGDINGVWKAADLALKCTAQASAQRPTMTEVVAQLRECLELGDSRADQDSDTGSAGSRAQQSSSLYTAGNASAGSSALEMENTGRMPAVPTGPAAR